MISDLSRTSAARLTLVTQAVTVALAAGAVALVVIGLPDRARPVASNQPVGVPPGMPVPGQADTAEPEVTTVAYAPVDMGGLAERLGLVANAPAEPVVDTPDDPETTDPIPENDPPQPFASRVRYLGMISFGTRNAAFVNIDGRQRIAKEGEVIAAPTQRPELGDLTITKVESDRIEISHEDGQAEIGLAEREGSSITMVAGGEVMPLAVQNDPAAQTGKATDEFEYNSQGNRRSQEQLDRRRRALERQRTQDPRDYEGPGLVMPDNIRRGNIGNRRRGGNEQPERGNQDRPADD